MTAQHNQGVKWISSSIGFVIPLFSLEGLTASPVFAQGCAMCQTVLPQADEPIARGMFWCVMILLTAPFAVCATIGGWLVYHYRRAIPPHSRTASATMLHIDTLQQQKNV